MLLAVVMLLLAAWWLTGSYWPVLPVTFGLINLLRVWCYDSSPILNMHQAAVIWGFGIALGVSPCLVRACIRERRRRRTAMSENAMRDQVISAMDLRGRVGGRVH